MKIFKLPIDLLGNDINTDDEYIDEYINRFSEKILQDYTRVAISKDSTNILLYDETQLSIDMEELFNARSFLNACMYELSGVSVLDDDFDINTYVHILEIVYGYVSDEYIYYNNSADVLIDAMYDYAYKNNIKLKRKSE